MLHVYFLFFILNLFSIMPCFAEFQQEHVFNTRGAAASASVIIDNTIQLAFADYFSDATHIYQKLPAHAGFSLLQTLSTISPRSVKFFKQFGKDYLIVASNESPSVLYQWDPTSQQWRVYQRFWEEYVNDWEHFVIGEEHFLIVANGFSVETATLYRYDALQKEYRVYQLLQLPGVISWEAFTWQNTMYLAGAAAYNYPTSYLFKWDPETMFFETLQSFATQNARSTTFFEWMGEANLIIADEIQSTRYLWNESLQQFTKQQILPTRNATSMAFFNIAQTPYLAIAEAADSVGIWQMLEGTARFEKLETLPALHPEHVSYFTDNAQHTLTISNFGYYPDYTGPSVLYEWQ